MQRNVLLGMMDISVEMLTSPGCHNCEVFATFWETEKENWPKVSFKEVNITEPEGQEIAQKYMIMASPGILINGELFSTGGVNQKEFLEKLKELSAG